MQPVWTVISLPLHTRGFGWAERRQWVCIQVLTVPFPALTLNWSFTQAACTQEVLIYSYRRREKSSGLEKMMRKFEIEWNYICPLPTWFCRLFLSHLGLEGFRGRRWKRDLVSTQSKLLWKPGDRWWHRAGNGVICLWWPSFRFSKENLRMAWVPETRAMGVSTDSIWEWKTVLKMVSSHGEPREAVASVWSPGTWKICDAWNMGISKYPWKTSREKLNTS